MSNTFLQAGRVVSLSDDGVKALRILDFVGYGLSHLKMTRRCAKVSQRKQNIAENVIYGDRHPPGHRDLHAPIYGISC